MKSLPVPLPRATDLVTIELEHVSKLGDGRTVEWEALGEGEPLVWVEGGPGLPAHLARADVVPVLDRFRCILINAPGCGRSSSPHRTEDYDLAGHVEFFDAARRALGLGPVTVMGHSWGGLVAAAWAAMRPEAVRRLIVVAGYAGAGSVDPAAAEVERERALARLHDRPWFAEAYAAMTAAFATPAASEAELVGAFRAFLPFYFVDPESPVARSHLERLRRETRFNPEVNARWSEDSPWETADYRDLLRDIRCPTLVLAGDHDWICGPTWAEPLAAAIPGAEYAVLAGQAHLPQYEAPELFRATIDAWLANSR